jgi:hypothetical protein
MHCIFSIGIQIPYEMCHYLFSIIIYCIIINIPTKLLKQFVCGIRQNKDNEMMDII